MDHKEVPKDDEEAVLGKVISLFMLAKKKGNGFLLLMGDIGGTDRHVLTNLEDGTDRLALAASYVREEARRGIQVPGIHVIEVGGEKGAKDDLN